jgi:hypothetical protein
MVPLTNPGGAGIGLYVCASLGGGGERAHTREKSGKRGSPPLWSAGFRGLAQTPFCGVCGLPKGPVGKWAIR